MERQKSLGVKLGTAALKAVGALTIITASLALKNADGGKDPYGVDIGFKLLGGPNGLVNREAAKKLPHGIQQLHNFGQDGGY
jgi:hypothetical protein